MAASRAQYIAPDASDDTFLNGVDCSLIRDVPFSERCDFVVAADNCNSHEAILSYLDLVYCKLRVSSSLQEKACIPLLLLFLLLCFYVLGVAADKRLCPALQMLSKMLKMSEVLAGVTLVAFGNCAPDFFTSFFSVNDPDRQVYSDLYASAMLVTSIIPGLIIVISPFRVHGSSVLRDTSFILLGIILINFYIREHGFIKYYQSLIMMSIYAIYIVVVFLDQYFLKKAMVEDEQIEVDTNQRRATVNRFQSSTDNKNQNLFQDFLQGINPVNKAEWTEGSKLTRAMMIVKVPIYLLINISMPNTDYEEDKNGWCKLLNCIQLVAMPVVTLYLILPEKMYPYYCMAGSVGITLPLAIYFFVTSSVSKYPKHHWVFAVYSAVGATVALAIVAEEVCELIYVLGLFLGMSSSFLAATVLAWGNSIGDFVANLMLAHQGFQAMGFAACFGAPIFNVFFTMGLTLTLVSQKHGGEFELKKGVFGETCNIFMIINSVLTIIWMTLLDFNARRMIGILLIFMYCFFFAFTVLTEIHVIDSYNSVRSDVL